MFYTLLNICLFKLEELLCWELRKWFVCPEAPKWLLSLEFSLYFTLIEIFRFGWVWSSLSYLLFALWIFKLDFLCFKWDCFLRPIVFGGAPTLLIILLLLHLSRAVLIPFLSVISGFWIFWDYYFSSLKCTCLTPLVELTYPRWIVRIFFFGGLFNIYKLPLLFCLDKPLKDRFLCRLI